MPVSAVSEEERLSSEEVAERQKPDLLGPTGYGKELEFNPVHWESIRGNRTGLHF